jgi:branched-chain amino acid transport system ATP-binding protein
MTDLPEGPRTDLLLQVQDLHGGYGAVDVLRGVSLEVAPGGVVALIGANGAGKTTAMRLISGLLKPARGSVLLDGAPIQGLDGSRIAALGLAHAPEGRKVFGPLSTEANLLLGAYTWLPKVLGYRKAAAADLEAVYDRFQKLRERRRQQAGTLSGGEQQMLAIGRALMARPKLLLLDEPSMGLAPVMIQEVYRAILRLKAEGTTLLLVEQFARTALQVADYAYVMERGRITVQGTPEQLGRDGRVVAAYLG